jgi:hypothetical protein
LTPAEMFSAFDYLGAKEEEEKLIIKRPSFLTPFMGQKDVSLYRC